MASTLPRPPLLPARSALAGRRAAVSSSGAATGAAAAHAARPRLLHRRPPRRRGGGSGGVASPTTTTAGAGAPGAAAAAGGSADDAPTPPPTPPPAAADNTPTNPSTTPTTNDTDDPPLWPRVAALLSKWTGDASPLRLLDPPLAAFLAGGVLVGAALLNWVSAVSPLRRVAPYQFTVVFSEAHKVGEGTPVRMKGVEIGVVKKVDVRPDAVAVGVEVFSGRQVVPLSSRIDVNALGLMADAIIDITPPEGFLAAEAAAEAAAGGSRRGQQQQPHAGPRDARCAAEARIVCDGARVAGHQGANMNFMMRLWLEHNDKTRTKVEW